jgi:hypothetical protein
VNRQYIDMLEAISAGIAFGYGTWDGLVGQDLPKQIARWQVTGSVTQAFWEYAYAADVLPDRAWEPVVSPSGRAALLLLSAANARMSWGALRSILRSRAYHDQRLRAWSGGRRRTLARPIGYRVAALSLSTVNALVEASSHLRMCSDTNLSLEPPSLSSRMSIIALQATAFVSPISRRILRWNRPPSYWLHVLSMTFSFSVTSLNAWRYLLRALRSREEQELRAGKMREMIERARKNRDNPPSEPQV